MENSSDTNFGSAPKRFLVEQIFRSTARKCNGCTGVILFFYYSLRQMVFDEVDIRSCFNLYHLHLAFCLYSRTIQTFWNYIFPILACSIISTNWVNFFTPPNPTVPRKAAHRGLLNSKYWISVEDKRRSPQRGNYPKDDSRSDHWFLRTQFKSIENCLINQN